MPTRFLLRVIIAGVLPAGLAHAVDIPTSLGDGADTYLTNDSSSGPTAAHGSEMVMEIRHSSTRLRILYIRFDLSGVAGDLSGASITLNGTNINRDRPLDFRGVIDGATGGQGETWNESTLSYSDAAGLDPSAALNTYAFTAEVTPSWIAHTAGSAIGPNTTLASTDLDNFLAADMDGRVTFVVLLEETVNGSEDLFFSTKEGGTAPILHLPNATSLNDVDADGLDDLWEDFHFGNGDGTATIGELALQNGNGNPDGDNFDNEAEETAGTDPNDAAAYPGGPHFIYVAPDGDDVNPGTIDQPFATVARAQQEVVAGSTIYFRGGKYAIDVGQVAQYNSVFARVFLLNKSGSAGSPIRYWAYPGEEPIFDLDAVNPSDYRVYTFYVTGNWLHFRGLTVIGVQVNITAHTQSICFDNEGSNNIYERLVMRDNQAIGMWIGNGSNNLVLNCDAYRNWDYTSEGGVGGNVDGFGCHVGTGKTGNVFRGCRAWFNSDDGYDCINAASAVTFEHCWAAYNGYDYNFVSRGDGNGFKAGGYGAPPGTGMPAILPRHVVRDCMAVGNKQSGFYSNHHPGGVTFIGNTALRNKRNFNLLCWSLTAGQDVPGFDHILRNNVGLNATTEELASANIAACDSSHNAWDLAVTVDGTDFQSIDEAYLTAPRQPSGELPVVPLMRLTSGSDLIDAGTSTGDPFAGTAPDLGCYEFDVIEVGNHDFSLPVVSTTAAVPRGHVWTFESGAGVKLDGADQVAYVDGSGALQQTFDGFEIGETYHVHLESSAPAGTADLELLIDGGAVATRSVSGSIYQPLDAAFISTSTQHTLRLAGAGSVDELRIATVEIKRVSANSDSDTDTLKDLWEFTWFGDLQQNASDDFDHDGSADSVEQALSLNPTAGSEAFRSFATGSGEVQWPGAPGIDFTVFRSTDLSGWSEIATVPGVAPTTTYTDPTPPPGNVFYRIGFTP